ncbi:hypothetical protein YTPLAS18_00940 [Nitrospira sp.]|nr:hypothetical protein YTPLAS18_00940 [Nitrospira sp.]
MALRPSMIALGLLLLVGAGACARMGPQPIIEPSAALTRSGSYDPAEDLRLCRQTVSNAAPISMQPRWLPPLSMTETGVVLGSVDVPHPVWPSQTAYRQEMEHCLSARGYEVSGWH